VDHLTGAVALGLEQHRVHRTLRLEPRGPGLQRLGVGHLAARLIHPGVVAHVLPLEGQRRFAAAAQYAAEGGRHQRLAGTAAGAEHHQGGGREPGQALQSFKGT